MLTGDASVREYYRITIREKSMVAMVYPQGGSDEEIRRVIRFSGIYREAGLNVPEIIDRPDENILIQEDVGRLSLQNHLASLPHGDLPVVKKEIHDILEKIGAIPSEETGWEMDAERIRFEMEFFIENFVNRFLPDWERGDDLYHEIMETLKGLQSSRTFAHRDFHSRNIFVRDGVYFLIDFQDSLRAPEHYDAVSFVFDSYIRTAHSEYFLSLFEELNEERLEQVYLTAYQRTIKALGTFGYQYFSGNRSFYQYIGPALVSLKRNALYSGNSLLARMADRFENLAQP